MLFYRTHGNMYADDGARKLYTEIAEIEEQHVTQYEISGDPAGSPLLKMALLQLNEAYNYYSCAMTETDDRLCDVWGQFCEEEIAHFLLCNELMKKFEKKDIRDILDVKAIEPLIVFEPNKEYVNQVLATQEELQPRNMKFVNFHDLPSDWSSFAYRDKVNAGGVPSEEVVDRAQQEAQIPKAA
jgi:hypothetical protein